MNKFIFFTGCPILCCFGFLLSGCGDDSHKVSKENYGLSEKEKDPILMGEWGYQNHYFSFSNENVSFYENGIKNSKYSGRFEIIDQNRGRIIGNGLGFYYEVSRQNELTLMFDDGTGGAEMPQGIFGKGIK